MVTQANYEKVKDWEGLWTISALTHQQILNLLERKLITPELFDERKVIEVMDPDHPKLRYCLCRNPETEAREGATRQRLLELTKIGLRSSPNPNARPMPPTSERAWASSWPNTKWASS